MTDFFVFRYFRSTNCAFVPFSAVIPIFSVIFFILKNSRKSKNPIDITRLERLPNNTRYQWLVPLEFIAWIKCCIWALIIQTANHTSIHFVGSYGNYENYHQNHFELLFKLLAIATDLLLFDETSIWIWWNLIKYSNKNVANQFWCDGCSFFLVILFLWNYRMTISKQPNRALHRVNECYELFGFARGSTVDIYYNKINWTKVDAHKFD